MRDLKVAAAQFEPHDGDKEYNLGMIRRLTKDAIERGAEVVSFHETCLTGYAYLQSASRDVLLAAAEPVPGPSTAQVHQMAKEMGVPILFGLFEHDAAEDKIYNTYVCVTPHDEVLARHRKLHAFLNKHLSCGDIIQPFELCGARCAILICYDNNIGENVRAAALAGVEVLFSPHVAGCAKGPKTAAGIGDPCRGLVAPELWANRDRDPVALRLALTQTGRNWFMKWLPSRAYDNALFVVFTNPIGMDYGEVRPGHAMVLDPFGEVISECCSMSDEVCVAHLDVSKRAVASGSRFLKARRPELYGVIADVNSGPPRTAVKDMGPGWKPIAQETKKQRTS